MLRPVAGACRCMVRLTVSERSSRRGLKLRSSTKLFLTPRSWLLFIFYKCMVLTKYSHSYALKSEFVRILTFDVDFTSDHWKMSQCGGKKT